MGNAIKNYERKMRRKKRQMRQKLFSVASSVVVDTMYGKGVSKESTERVLDVAKKYV